jgi:hypothetical protein
MSVTIKYYCLKDDLSINLVQQDNLKVLNSKLVIQKNRRYPGIEKNGTVTLYIHEMTLILEIDVKIEELIEIFG